MSHNPIANLITGPASAPATEPVANLIADRMQRARTEAGQRMAAAAATVDLALAADGAEDPTRPTRRQLKQLRADARAEGKQLKADLLAQGKELKSRRKGR
ncbi:hypothetical protein ACIP5Y_02855 [Nocardia sp. NPDC088792]|uniref:hypothetical protein n=1 Tax=Nocardia sp. NPDC088792 TaxID=3364332 RepID=UPI00382B1D2A